MLEFFAHSRSYDVITVIDSDMLLREGWFTLLATALSGRRASGAPLLLLFDWGSVYRSVTDPAFDLAFTRCRNAAHSLHL